jgi:hypothetical protein
MTPIITIQTQLDIIAAPLQAPLQAQYADVSPQDTEQFQQALVSQARKDSLSTDLIRDGIAAIEQQDAQFKTALSRLAGDGPSSLSMASVQSLMLEQQKIRVAYEAEARVISIMAQNTNELTHMQ